LAKGNETMFAGNYCPIGGKGKRGKAAAGDQHRAIKCGRGGRVKKDDSAGGW